MEEEGEMKREVPREGSDQSWALLERECGRRRRSSKFPRTPRGARKKFMLTLVEPHSPLLSLLNQTELIHCLPFLVFLEQLTERSQMQSASRCSSLITDHCMPHWPSASEVELMSTSRSVILLEVWIDPIGGVRVCDMSSEGIQREE